MPQIRANGIDIEYESFGRDADPAILMIMGFGAQLSIWPDSLPQGLAAKGFRVIRFDNRDVGKSTHLLDKGAPDLKALVEARMAGKPIQVPYRLDDMAQDAASLLEALGIERAHILGASMGGMIAQLVAAQHPGRTKSLISIMSTTGRRDLPPSKPEAFAALMTPPASDRREDRIDCAIRIRRALASPGFPTGDAEMRERVERDVDRVPYEPTGTARQMAAIIAASPRNEILKTVRAPALVMHGADDPLVTVEGGIDTAQSIPGAELAVVPGMSHECCEALVPVYLRHVGDFLARVEGRAAA